MSEHFMLEIAYILMGTTISLGGLFFIYLMVRLAVGSKKKKKPVSENASERELIEEMLRRSGDLQQRVSNLEEILRSEKVTKN